MECVHVSDDEFARIAQRTACREQSSTLPLSSDRALATDPNGLGPLYLFVTPPAHLLENIQISIGT